MANTLMLIEVRPLKTYIEIARFQDICVANVFSFSFIGFSNTPTPFTVHSSRPLNVKSLRGFTIGNPLGCRDSARVEVMITLHERTPSLLRRVEGYIPPKGMIASARDILKFTHIHLESP